MLSRFYVFFPSTVNLYLSLKNKTKPNLTKSLNKPLKGFIQGVKNIRFILTSETSHLWILCRLTVSSLVGNPPYTGLPTKDETVKTTQKYDDLKLDFWFLHTFIDEVSQSK